MKQILFLLSMAMIIFPAAAQAVTIRNLDENAYTLTVNDGGEEKNVELQPNSIYRTAGPFVKITLKGQKTIRTRSTYAEVMIRKGKLSLQRQNSRTRRH